MEAPDIPHRRLRDGIRTGGHLHTFFPFLLPGVSQQVIILRGHMMRVWQFHGTDQVFSEHLQREGPNISYCGFDQGKYQVTESSSVQTSYLCRFLLSRGGGARFAPILVRGEGR